MNPLLNVKNKSIHFDYTAKRSKSQYCKLQFDIMCLTERKGERLLYRRIRDLREDRDLTQKEMAKLLNCSQQVYSNYELGQRDIPTDILIKLSKIHNVSIDYILEVSDCPTIQK